MAITAGNTAKVASTYEACCALIYYLAKDKVIGENETDLYLMQKINPFIDPAIVNMARDMDAAVNQLHYDRDHDQPRLP